MGTDMAEGDGLGARDPKVNSLFQIADVDNGTVRWVNADLVSHVVHGLDGVSRSAF